MKLHPQARKRVQEQLTLLQQRAKAHVVVDTDTHVTSPRAKQAQEEQRKSDGNYYHGRSLTVDELLRELDAAGVDMALCWQNPAATPYSDSRERNREALQEANGYVFESAQRFPERIIPAGWTDPAALGVDAAIDMAEYCVCELGFPIVKMNPAQNRFPIDSKEVFAVVEAIVASGATPAFHFGADTAFTPASGLEAIARKWPGSPVIAVHMGGGGASYLEAEELYAEARELGLRNGNLHYVMSAKRDVHIASDVVSYQLAGEPFSMNLSVGSDAPYGNVSWTFGGFRSLLESLRSSAGRNDPRLQANQSLINNAAELNLLGGNFVRLVIRSYESILTAT